MRSSELKYEVERRAGYHTTHPWPMSGNESVQSRIASSQHQISDEIQGSGGGRRDVADDRGSRPMNAKGHPGLPAHFLSDASSRARTAGCASPSPPHRPLLPHAQRTHYGPFSSRATLPTPR
ncbi:hypothetical protein MRX96_014148 [Rhipicephalus microplus]